MLLSVTDLKTFAAEKGGRFLSSQTGRAAQAVSDEGYRPATQMRSIETERRVLEAAEVLFAEHGYSGAKIADILERSECSTGSFYHRFRDKEGLFRKVMENYFNYVHDFIDTLQLDRETCKTLPGLFRAVVFAAFENIKKNRGFYRAARELMHTDPDIWKSVNELNFRLATRLDEVLPEYVGDICAPDPETALRAASQLILTTVLYSESGRAPLFPKDEDVFTEMLVNAAMGIVCPSNSA